MLRLEGVTRSFGALRAVDGLSLRAAPGETLGLLGPNGAGKTTTLSMIIGRLRPDAGTVRVGGESPTRASARRRIGVAPQELALYDELTAMENLRFFAGLYGLSRREARAAAEGALERVGLLERARDRVRTFSGGMKRRLNLAAAVAHGPDLILLDEPTAGVDPHSRHAIFEFVRALRSEGRAVVYTTHYMEEAERLCDRVAIVDHGRLLAEGRVGELVAAHGGPPRVIVETAEGETEHTTETPMEAVARALADPRTREVHVERADLEAVFLRLTGRSLRD